MDRALVTGGAGFIGSHLVDALLARKVNVHVLDNLSSGCMNSLEQHFSNSNFMFRRGDLLERKDVAKAVEDCEVVFHLAANPEVRTSSISPEVHYKQNIVATFNLLEALRKTGSVTTIVFTSSSTVYGEASKIPTPEDYAPLEPVSIYGATKLACEALITAYAHTYGFKAVVYRFANIVGPRNKHGVIHDFITKLQNNPNQLEILGDGSQTKSYLYIDDCIQAMIIGLKTLNRQVEMLNVGSEDQIDVKTIARIVTEEMRLKNVKFRFTGGVDGGRGWKGDVKNMLLDTNRLKVLGWTPKLKSAEATKQAAKNALSEMNNSIKNK